MLGITRRKSTSASLICLLSVGALSLTACAESADSNAVSSESASVTSMDENTPTLSPTESSASPSTEAPTTDSTGPEDTGSLTTEPTDTSSPEGPIPGVTPETGAPPPPADGGELHLENFHNPEKWEENLFNVANRRQVPGMAATVGCEYYSGRQELEIRLGERYKLITFSIAQEQGSKTSGATMIVTITQNNKQTEVRKVAFGKVLDFKLNVANVNPLKIGFELESPTGQPWNSCGNDYEVTAVVFDARIA